MTSNRRVVVTRHGSITISSFFDGRVLLGTVLAILEEDWKLALLPGTGDTKH